MRFGNLIFGVALLLVAATLALTITFRNDPKTQAASGDQARADAPRGSQLSGRTPLSAQGPNRRSNPRTTRNDRPAAEDMDVVLDDRASAPPLSPAEREVIAARAEGVKRAALTKLDKMTGHFDLTRDQRRKIFPLLVESTNGYHPAMVVTQPGGGRYVPVDTAAAKPDQTADEAIHDVLDPDQQDKFVDAAIDDIKWWDEIVTQLEEDLDSAVAAGTAPPVEDPAEPDDTPAPPADPAPADPAPQQGDNIFDLLNR